MDQLQFWILNERKRALYKNSSGLIVEADNHNLKADGYPAHLKSSPEGWQDSLVKYARNPKSLGATRDFTVPLDFVGDGESIVLDSKWRNGSDIIRYLVVNDLDKVAFPDRYNHFYTGELDFSKMTQKNDRTTLQVTEGGLSKNLKANEGTQYEFRIDTDAFKKKLFFTGIPFTNKVEYKTFSRSIYRPNTYPQAGTIYQEGNTQGVIIQDQRFQVDPTNDQIRQNYFFYSVSKSTTVNLTGQISIGEVLGPVDIEYIRFAKRNDADIGTETVYTVSGPLTPPSNPYIINFNIDIPIEPGDKLYFYANVTLGSHPLEDSILFNEGTGWVATYDVLFDNTMVEGISLKRLGQLLLNRISPGAVLLSSFLDSFEDVIFLTSGQALRKYGAEAYIKTSWNDFYQSIKRFGVGYDTVGPNVVLEKHSYFFKPTVSMSLGVVKDFEISDASDLIYNTFKLGSPVVDLGKENGRDEPNFLTYFTSPVKREVKEMDLSTVYQTGMYAIEIARISFFGKDTTDSEVDNTVYMINTAKGLETVYYEGPFEVVSTTEIQIPTRGLAVILDSDTITITGTATDGTYVINAQTISDTLTQLGSTAGGLTPGSYTGVLTLNSADTYILNRPNFTSITGIMHPDEAFNLLLDPKRALLDNGSYIRSIMDFHDSKELDYTKGDRNSNLSTTIDGLTVTENADEPIGGLAPQIFKPYYIKFSTMVPINYNSLMTNNPYELVEFELSRFPGVTWTGYIWDGGMNPGTNESQEWVLLFGPNNDMSKLIKR